MRKLLRLAFIVVGLVAGLGLYAGISELQAQGEAKSAPSVAQETASKSAEEVIKSTAKTGTQGDTLDPPSPNGEKRDMAAIQRVFSNPVVIEATEDPAMAVTFFHTDHKGLNCAVCHHRLTAAAERYVSCGSSPDCHVRKGISPRGKSLFQAMHNPTSAHSCYGCHLKERARFDDVKGCTTCHANLAVQQ